MFCNEGMEIMSSNISRAIKMMSMAARFFSANTAIKLLVLERLVRIRKILPMMSDEKVMALISPTECPSRMERK